MSYGQHLGGEYSVSDFLNNMCHNAPNCSLSPALSTQILNTNKLREPLLDYDDQIENSSVWSLLILVTEGDDSF